MGFLLSFVSGFSIDYLSSGIGLVDPPGYALPLFFPKTVLGIHILLLISHVLIFVLFIPL